MGHAADDEPDSCTAVTLLHSHRCPTRTPTTSSHTVPIAKTHAAYRAAEPKRRQESRLRCTPSYATTHGRLRLTKAEGFEKSRIFF